MARGTRKKSRRKRGFRYWYSLITMLGAGALALLYNWYELVELPAGEKARVFGEYARLNLTMSDFRRMRESPSHPRTKPQGEPWRTIVRAVDGDTMLLNDGRKVRLIGIDTPESSENNEFFRDLGKMDGAVKRGDLLALGKEASRRVRDMSEGKRCWLEYEDERYDQYNRPLAYLHLEDGTVLNEEILARGYAKVYLSFKFKYKKRYVFAQLSAMRNRTGFWAGDDAPDSGRQGSRDLSGR